MPSRSPEQTPANSCSYPLKLEPFFQERVWGRKDLSYLYESPPASPHPVGEVWLTADSNRVANGAWKGSTLGELCRSCGPELLGRQIHHSRSQSPQAFPLLVKFLFTTEKLSVQVHPPDPYARKREGSDGKTEMWHVLQAEAGARLAVGFRQELMANQGLDRKALQAAIENGDIEQMLYWREVSEGETFYVPAGTIHTIGAGLILCEIQQNSDALSGSLWQHSSVSSEIGRWPIHGYLLVQRAMISPRFVIVWWILFAHSDLILSLVSEVMSFTTKICTRKKVA